MSRASLLSYTSLKTQQPALFELKDDRRSVAERTAAGRYREPSLFST